MQVQNYILTASNGRKIRTATQVTLENGKVIRFTEKLSKRQAIRQANKQRMYFYISPLDFD